jgi:hypothetical protein
VTQRSGTALLFRNALIWTWALAPLVLCVGVIVAGFVLAVTHG